MTARSTLLTIHLWIGIVAAPVLLVLGVTGALLVIENPISDRLDRRTAVVTPGDGPPKSIGELVTALRRDMPGAELVAVQLPQDRVHSAALTVKHAGRAAETLLLDPYTGRVLGRPSEQTFFRRVRQLHRQLLMGSGGNALVLGVTVGLVLLAVTGPAVWWPRRRVGVRWARGGWRLILDLHALLGAISCVFLFLFAVTGVVVHWDAGVQRILGRITGTVAPHQPQGLAANACDASTTLGPDQVIAAAGRAIPGARPTSLQLGSGGPTVARVVFKFPEDRTPAGRSMAFIDECSGVAVFTINTRRAPVAYLFPREWNREIHTGDLFGWPTQALAFVFSLSLAAMAITGPLVWAMRREGATVAQASVDILA